MSGPCCETDIKFDLVLDINWRKAIRRDQSSRRILKLDCLHFISTKSYVWTESLWGFLNESILNPDKVFKCLVIWRKRRHWSNSEGFGAKFKWNLVYKLHPQIISYKTMALKVCRLFIVSRVGKSRVYMKSMQTAKVQNGFLNPLRDHKMLIQLFLLPQLTETIELDFSNCKWAALEPSKMLSLPMKWGIFQSLLRSLNSNLFCLWGMIQARGSVINGKEFRNHESIKWEIRFRTHVISSPPLQIIFIVFCTSHHV